MGQLVLWVIIIDLCTYTVIHWPSYYTRPPLEIIFMQPMTVSLNYYYYGVLFYCLGMVTRSYKMVSKWFYVCGCVTAAIGGEMITTPFPCCVLPNFIQDSEGFLDSLKDEILRLKYYEKNNDLYQFHQVAARACVCVYVCTFSVLVFCNLVNQPLQNQPLTERLVHRTMYCTPLPFKLYWILYSLMIWKVTSLHTSLRSGEYDVIMYSVL